MLPSSLTRVWREIWVIPIRIYRVFLSPILPPACRFYPTCSSYALEAILRHGPLKGGWLAFRRICRCQPWGGSGYDPVPDPPQKGSSRSPHSNAGQ